MAIETVSRYLGLSIVLEDLLGTLGAAAILIDPQKRVRWLNPAAAEILETSLPEASGRPCWEVVASDACGPACAVDGDLGGQEESHAVHIGMRLVRGECQTPISIQGVRAKDRTGREVGTLCLIRDVRQIAGLVADLRRSCDHFLARELRTRAILNSITEGVFTTDETLAITSFNKTAERITGWTQSEVLGKPCYDILGYRPKELSPLQRTMLCGANIETETFFRHRNGSRIPVRVHTSLLKDVEGQVLGGVETFRDVGEMKRLAMRYMDQTPFFGIVGKNRRLREILDLLQVIKDSDSTVLITGESGTGKGLLAKAIHLTSHRAERPFVKVNCSVFAESLLESELFGHERGAFTGAVKARKGRFEVADGGTVFLDEIGEVSKNIQLKLLGVLQEKEFERVGGSEPHKADVKIIAATNKDLLKAVRNREFREDLFYRLNVIPIHLPPLRERREDIPLLADFFIQKFCGRTGRKPKRMSAEALSLLGGYSWPGNIRELENAIEHGLVCSRGQTTSVDSLPDYLVAASHVSAGPVEHLKRPGNGEEARIRAALEAAKWNRTLAAGALQMNRATLWRKMRRYGIT
jgi:PAS domain S-box-containing protein